MFNSSGTVQDGICALEKANMFLTIFQKFPWHCIKTVIVFDWWRPFLFPSKEDHQAFPLFMHLLHAINGAVSLDLCLQVVFQAPQHFRPPEMQAICDGCFACHSVCLVIFLHSSTFLMLCTECRLPMPCCYFTWRCARLFQSMEQGPLKNSDVLILTCLTQTPLAMPDPMIGEFCHNSGG